MSIKYFREDLDTSATTAGTASTGAAETGEETRSASSATRDEINDATVKLQNHFDRIAGAFRDQIRQFVAAVNGSDWEGQAKQGAIATATRFNTQLDQLVAQTTTAISDFKTWMINQSEAYNEDVTSGLGQLLDQFGERYNGLSTTITDFTAQMEQVDASGNTRFAG